MEPEPAAGAPDPDEEALAFLRPDETAAQMLARTFVAPLHTGLPLIDRFMTCRGGQVIEIASAAGGGRTTALLQVAATCILPAEAGGVAYGGKGAHVVFFDLDAKLDVVRLLEMLDARAAAAQAQAGARDGDTMPVLLDSLSRFHLVRCHSSFDALAALAAAPPLLERLAAAPGGLACLLLDNVAAHYYADKAGRGPPSGGGGALLGAPRDLSREGAPLTLFRVHAALAGALRALCARFRLPVVASKHLVLPGSPWGSTLGKGGGGQPADGWAHRDPMMRPWQDVVTHRLMLRHDGSGGGGSGGGGGAPDVRLAKWQDEPAVIRFTIDAAGIQLC